jgi:hypothetical protein
MDYTKFLYGKNKEKNKFKLNLTNTYIKESIQTLKDMQKANYILQNYHKFNYNVNLDEYMAYFLKEKNFFIDSFKENIKTSKLNPDISEDTILVYNEIFKILKSNLGNLITNYKIIKQDIYKKGRQQEKFYEKKFIFFAENEKVNDNKTKIELLKEIPNKIKKIVVKNLPFNIENVEEKIKNKYKEATNVVEMLMDKEKQNLQKTKKIIFDLSSLNTNVQKKLHAQGEMTKNILFNSFQSVNNVEKGNKHLSEAKKYQKGRGLTIGLIFIILGLFLIIYDR